MSAIEAMPVGSQFSAQRRGYPFIRRQCERVEGPYVLMDGVEYLASAIDPSTIRDVTPPEDAA